VFVATDIAKSVREKKMLNAIDKELLKVIEIYKQKNPQKYEQRKEELERKLQLIELQ